MTSFVRIAAALSLAALAIGASVPTVAAVKADLAIVQGVPGKVVDVCLDGREIRSGLPYGAKLLRAINPGDRRLTFHARQRGGCQGARLAGRILDLAPGADVTVVSTARAPKVVVFDNAGVDSLPPLAEGSLALRHAADLGAVVMRLEFADGTPFEPDADPEFGKRDGFTGFFVDDVMQLWATYQATPSDPIAAIIIHLEAGRRYDIELVGTNVRNARFVVVRKPLSP
jgi:hypothetical protein